MRRVALIVSCAAMAVAAVSPSVRAGGTASSIHASDERSLKEGLLTLAQERLQPRGLSVGRERAWLSLSGPLPAAGTFEVDASWFAGAAIPSLPLIFDLQPARPAGSSSVVSSDADAPRLQATLATSLLRDVLVATRRLRKGSVVTCEDLRAESRDIREVFALALSVPCAIGHEIVALRDIAARDAVRSVDIGTAPDIAAGSPVRVSVTTNGVHVTTTAIALSDAKAGDQIDVRLRHPTRTLRTRVTGPGTVQLADQAP